MNYLVPAAIARSWPLQPASHYESATPRGTANLFKAAASYSETGVAVSRGHSVQVDATVRERQPCATPDRTKKLWFRSILGEKGHTLFAPIRFLWNATRGHRLAPWRSEYFRWRVETYSGKKAEKLTTEDIFSFVWTSRWELLAYLGWIGRLDREVHKHG